MRRPRPPDASAQARGAGGHGTPRLPILLSKASPQGHHSPVSLPGPQHRDSWPQDTSAVEELPRPLGRRAVPGWSARHPRGKLEPRLGAPRGSCQASGRVRGSSPRSVITGPKEVMAGAVTAPSAPESLWQLEWVPVPDQLRPRLPQGETPGRVPNPQESSHMTFLHSCRTFSIQKQLTAWLPCRPWPLPATRLPQQGRQLTHKGRLPQGLSAGAARQLSSVLSLLL